MMADSVCIKFSLPEAVAEAHLPQRQRKEDDSDCDEYRVLHNISLEQHPKKPAQPVFVSHRLAGPVTHNVISRLREVLETRVVIAQHVCLAFRCAWNTKLPLIRVPARAFHYCRYQGPCFRPNHQITPIVAVSW